MKSIMQEKDGTCYLCVKFDNNYFTHNVIQEHHVVFGGFGAGRKLSEKFGLKVYLCPMHHLSSGCKDAVHRSKETKLMLCKEAQKAFEEKYPNLSFREIFGKNYLDDEDRKNKGQQDTELGFIQIEDGLEEMEW